MKVSILEVQVTSPEGVPFHEVQDPRTGEIYVVARAGKQFELRFKVDSKFLSYLVRDHIYQIGAVIDGRNIGCGNTFKYNTQADRVCTSRRCIWNQL